MKFAENSLDKMTSIDYAYGTLAFALTLTTLTFVKFGENSLDKMTTIALLALVPKAF